MWVRVSLGLPRRASGVNRGIKFEVGVGGVQSQVLAGPPQNGIDAAAQLGEAKGGNIRGIMLGAG